MGRLDGKQEHWPTRLGRPTSTYSLGRVMRDTRNKLGMVTFHFLGIFSAPCRTIT